MKDHLENQMTQDFSRHNAEVRQVWESYRAGRPWRVPMVLTSVARIWVLDPTLNRAGITWKEYLNDPDLMFDISLKHQYYVSHNIPQDAEMGIPAEQWNIHTEFGNVYEEAWFGCEIVYPEGQIAATLPFCNGERKEAVFEKGMPAPFSGFIGKMLEYYQYFCRRAEGFEFHSRPIQIEYPTALGSDGPLTIANGIRGSKIFEDMLNDEDYYHRLMSFITEAVITRILAWRERLGLDMRPACGGLADDAIQFISTRAYRDKVLPYHKRFFEALYGPGPHSMHLCGNVQRHFPTLIKELNVRSFDTGYPIDFTTLRDDIGEGVEIQGGVKVSDLLMGTPESVSDLTRTILESGIMRGGKFIIKEANDLAPGVPLANMQAMYAAVKKYGIYS